MKPETEAFLRTVIDLAQVSRVPELHALAGIAARALEIEGCEVERPVTPPIGSGPRGGRTAAERAKAWRANRKANGSNGSRTDANGSRTVSLSDSLRSSSPPLVLLSPSETRLSDRSTGAREAESGERIANANANGERSRTVRGTRVPRSDAPAEEVAAFAAKWGIDTKHAAWPEFLDYWRSASGKYGTKSDWAATWRNRLRDIELGRGELRRGSPLLQTAPATGRTWKVGQ